VVWRRHWSREDRLIIDFVGVAGVEIIDSTGCVTFDRVLPDEMEQHLLFDHVLPLVIARSGSVVVHAALISKSHTGIVLVGATGAGKSTLAAYAWQHGWTVGGDDGAVIHESNPLMVEPTDATIRLTPDSADLLGIEPTMSSAVIGKMRLAGGISTSFRQEPVELGSIVVIEPSTAGNLCEYERLGPVDAHSRLFGSTFHSDLSESRLIPKVLDQLAGIVERTEVGRLTIPRGVDGLVAAEEILGRLVEEKVARSSHVGEL
jgi:hypothetical protein